MNTPNPDRTHDRRSNAGTQEADRPLPIHVEVPLDQTGGDMDCRALVPELLGRYKAAETNDLEVFDIEWLRSANNALLAEREFAAHLKDDLSKPGPMQKTWVRLISLADLRIAGFSRPGAALVSLVPKSADDVVEIMELSKSLGLSAPDGAPHIETRFGEIEARAQHAAGDLGEDLVLPPQSASTVSEEDVRLAAFSGAHEQALLGQFRERPADASRLLHALGATEFRPLRTDHEHHVADIAIGNGRRIRIGTASEIDDARDSVPDPILERRLANGLVMQVIPSGVRRSSPHIRPGQTRPEPLLSRSDARRQRAIGKIEAGINEETPEIAEETAGPQADTNIEPRRTRNV